MYVNVQGGTNAGWRRPKPQITPWFCQYCEKESRYRRCIDCGAEHP